MQDELRRMLKGEAEGERLDVPAAQIALIEYPDLDIAPGVVAELDSIAERVAARGASDGAPFVHALNTALFDELGFSGNDTAYYDPRNSCLNDVLSRRTGIPITLSVVYLEVSRRLGQPVYGVGLPGHFIVEYDGPEYAAFLDPFHRGKAMTAGECEALIASRVGAEVEPGSLSFRKATKQQIVTRMLQNLKGVYASRQMWNRALDVLNLLLEANPEDAAELRIRAVANLHLKRYAAGKADLERFLEAAPLSPEKAKVEEQIANLNKWSAQWN